MDLPTKRCEEEQQQEVAPVVRIFKVLHTPMERNKVAASISPSGVKYLNANIITI